MCLPPHTPYLDDCLGFVDSLRRRVRFDMEYSPTDTSLSPFKCVHGSLGVLNVAAIGSPFGELPPLSVAFTVPWAIRVVLLRVAPTDCPRSTFNSSLALFPRVSSGYFVAFSHHPAALLKKRPEVVA